MGGVILPNKSPPRSRSDYIIFRVQRNFDENISLTTIFAIPFGFRFETWPAYRLNKFVSSLFFFFANGFIARFVEPNRGVLYKMSAGRPYTYTL